MLHSPSTIDNITAALQVASTWAASIAAVIALLAAIFKPVRSGISWVIKKVYKTKDKQKELLDKIESVEDRLSKEIDVLSEKVDRSKMQRIRTTVLQFGGECRRGVPHRKESFMNIINMNEEYERLLDKYNISNGVYAVDYQFILRKYEECLDGNSFLN